MSRPSDYDDGSGAGGTIRAESPELGLKGWARWFWRQLTSMRVALMLLMLLAVAAVPGSVLPQRPQDPAAVLRYLQENPTTGEWLDRSSASRRPRTCRSDPSYFFCTTRAGPS